MVLSDYPLNNIGLPLITGLINKNLLGKLELGNDGGAKVYILFPAN